MMAARNDAGLYAKARSLFISRATMDDFSGWATPRQAEAVSRPFDTEPANAVWPLAIVQTCAVHLLRNTFRYSSKKDWDAIRRDVKPVYTAPGVAAAQGRQGRDAGQVGGRSTPRSATCGWTRGNGSHRSWTTTRKPAGSSARPTRSNH
ncbi:transposase [Bifidobacterium sp. DSM 109963]|uniref:Transposase n=1 Tax=Bifidobacterium panos TaxID=2675321 RepID=A0ABX1T158_9BIFI|nr:transposase [Bifidobacterium sp. DSM 109963]